MNGDGFDDIVQSSDGAAQVNIILSLGNGSFASPLRYSIAAGARSLTSGDFNNDSIVDIATRNSTTSISVLMGIGDGSLGIRTDYTVGNTGMTGQGVIAGDLNGDFYDDLVVADQADDTLSIFINNGSGGFLDRTVISAFDGPFALALGDMNGDGILDVASADLNSSTASIFLGNGDGTFNPPTSATTSGTQVQSVVIGDHSGDGINDLVVCTYNAANVDILVANTTKSIIMPYLDLTTQETALRALDTLDSLLTHATAEQGAVGAVQSRLTTALTNLQQLRENYLTAKSQITDVDVASEAANLVKNQILQQSAAAVLAQANQGPTIALALLTSA
jgi:flagellin-like hook-associated protein FlgL